ncbi:hypothetical protein N2152v2_003299 [Parachlorella kessleri]
MRTGADAIRLITTTAGSLVVAASQQEEEQEALSPPELDPELEARMQEILQEREAEVKVQHVVEQILNTAQEWEYAGREKEAVGLLRQGGYKCTLKGREKEAVGLLRQGMAELSEQWELGRLTLQQRISHLLYTVADYQGALQEARQVYAGLCRLSGDNSPEAVLFGLRLGILEAAAGMMSDGNPRIYRAGAMAGPSLQRMAMEAQVLMEEGGQEERLEALNSKAGELAVCLGKSNFYGAIFTIKQFVQEGKVEDVDKAWTNLDEAVVQGLSNMIQAMPPGVHQLSNAMREHSRLVEELSGHATLGERLRQQHAQLQKLLEQGPVLPGGAPAS